MQIMGRRAEGRPAIADYTVWTNELSREELMIILEGQRVPARLQPDGRPAIADYTVWTNELSREELEIRNKSRGFRHNHQLINNQHHDEENKQHDNQENGNRKRRNSYRWRKRRKGRR